MFAGSYTRPTKHTHELTVIVSVFLGNCIIVGNDYSIGILIYVAFQFSLVWFPFYEMNENET